MHIAGIGRVVLPAVPVADRIGAAAAQYTGWPRIAVAPADATPSALAADAVTQALTDARLTAADLRLVLYCGVSRDRPPSWSVATEIGRRIGTKSTTFGIDVGAGCAAPVAALDLAAPWLDALGGAAAIVAAERWTHAIDYADPANDALFGHADGAAAVIVAKDAQRSRARYLGAAYQTDARMNGLVEVRNEQRAMHPTPKNEIYASYVSGYSGVVTALKSRYGPGFDRVVCTQVSPLLLQMAGNFAGVAMDRVCNTAKDVGHVGAADVFLGLGALAEQGELQGRVLILASSAYSFAGAVLEA